jgi:uncharacterized membrane protein (GlpM family)/predicted RNA-binding Zn-ribbon protein involved in translation (DUF1610 family)
VTREERRLAERKTIALRAAPKDYAAPVTPASNPCLNCGTNVQRHYCPECGQRAIDPDPTLREFLQELAQEFLNWDGKLFSTFRLLLTRPGSLTQEYFVGRRASYISPLKLYLTCSVLYFAAGALVPATPPPVTSGNAVQANAGLVKVTASDRGAVERYLDSVSRSGKGGKQTFGSHLANAIRHEGELTTSLKAALPRVMFVLVPLFAALVGFAFRGRRMRYPQHLAFALHVHAFMFLALILTLAPGISRSRSAHASTGLANAIGVGNAILVGVSFALIAWYMVQAVRHVYATSLGAAVARSALVASVYFLAYGASMGVLFLLVVRLQF